jgi:ketosteroid isomerase-like protein
MYDQHDVEALERQFNAAMEEADTGSALDAVRRIYDEFDRADADTLSALLHPGFEVRMETSFIDGKTYKGVKGLLRWRGEMEEIFEEDRFEPQGIRFAANDRWLVLGRLQIKGGDEDGDELDLPLAHVFEQRDRKVARFTAYSDIGDALAAVGLSSP